VTTLVTHLSPVLLHEKDWPILSGVQEGLKVWIRYHIGRGPRLKWSSVYVRAELILEARHQTCCATLLAMVTFQDCRSILRSFSIFGYEEIMLYCDFMDNYSISCAKTQGPMLVIWDIHDAGPRSTV
jgi:hypothetical protein